jgi:hypothetical protein
MTDHGVEWQSCWTDLLTAGTSGMGGPNLCRSNLPFPSCPVLYPNSAISPAHHHQYRSCNCGAHVSTTSGQHCVGAADTSCLTLSLLALDFCFHPLPRYQDRVVAEFFHARDACNMLGTWSTRFTDRKVRQ